MKVLGLVMELNPPHNGHKYFIDKAIELVNPDVTIAIISTSFTMRGDISVVNKFDKTSLLLNNKIDLVLELPFLASNASCDYFCKNSINILSKFGVTDICFGCELDDLNKLRKLKDIYYDKSYNSYLTEYLQKGFSYSTSCNKALFNITTDLDLINNFSLPNNTLAIHYIATIDKIKEQMNKKINIHLVKRINNNYYDELPTSNISSATSIRKLLINNESIEDYVIDNNIDYIDQLSSYDFLYKILQSKLMIDNIDFNNILGIKEGIENRLISLSHKYNCYFDYVKSCCTKRYQENYIKRLILNIVLNVQKRVQDIEYYRVLGFNTIGEKYIKTLDKEIKAQIITTFKNITNEVSELELIATKLYSLITNNPSLYLKEFNIPIKIKKGE